MALPLPPRRGRRGRRRAANRNQLTNRQLNKRLTRLEMSVEDKIADVLYTNSAVDYDGDNQTLNGISQGDSDTTRDGDSIMCKSLHIHGQVASDGADIGCIRVIVVHDFQNTLTLIDDVIETTGSGTAFLSHINWDQRKSFKVLSDRRYQVMESWKDFNQFDLNMKLGIRTQFAAGQSTIVTGAIKVFCISSSDPTDMNLPNLWFRARIIYSDI
jgi:hypothetical protein